MAMDGCGFCLKFLLISFNFIALVLGLAVLGVGIWLTLDDSGQFLDSVDGEDTPVVINFSDVSNAHMLSLTAYAMIGIGGLTAIVSILSLIGGLRSIRPLLIITFLLQFIVFACTVTVGVYLYIMRDEIDVDKDKLYPLLHDSLKEAVKQYHDDETSKKFMDRIQNKLKCCGAESGGVDYAPLLSLPCNVLFTNTPCLPEYYKDVVSHIGVREFYQGKMTAGMWVAICLASFLIFCMILTLVLAIAPKRDE